MINKTKYKICRRLGAGIYPQCQTQKFTLSESRKGGKKMQKSGKGGPKPLSGFGRQLVEKQKLRFSYGLSEKQLSNYVKTAMSQKGMEKTQKLFEALEQRLDNIVYRLGLANSRRMARQMVSHGHIIVGDRRVTIPSYKISVGDKMKVRDASISKPLFVNLEERNKDYTIPTWLSFDIGKKEAVMQGLPKVDSEVFFDFNSVLEFYSR